MTIDLNCDLGESYYDIRRGNDALVLPHISSANIACGFHGGDPLTIGQTIRLALLHDVAIGAHPGYHDIKGFGRQVMELPADALYAAILFQVSALRCMASASGAVLGHVKPHGALYNKAAVDPETAQVIASAVRAVDPRLILVGLSGSELIRAAEAAGLQSASEVFADRAYNDDGTLVSRSESGSVLSDRKLIIERALGMVLSGEVHSVNGKTVALKADTICIHGDHDGAAELAAELRAAFVAAGVEVKSLGHAV